MVRAKFKVSNVEPMGNDNGTRVTLNPVIDGSEENKEFFRYTPGGQITLDTINDAAAVQFTPGAEFYVDFTPATNETSEPLCESFVGGEEPSPAAAV